MDVSIYLIFLITTFVVVFSPGPAAICAASQGAGNGTLRAMIGILGIAGANAVYFLLSALGIAALIIASDLLFSIIKWMGVAYLLYLGASAIRGKTGGIQIKRGARAPRWTLFSQGFIVEFANPKALLYFAAILPQFINTEANVVLQILIMGGSTLVIDVIVYTVYAYLGHRIYQAGLKSSIIRAINMTAGIALIFAAFKMVTVSSAR